MRALSPLLAVPMALGVLAAEPARPLLLQHPTLSATRIAFAFAGQIWTVAREGGEARCLVAGQGRCQHPIFSPDGSAIAFSASYDGNLDVYVVPAAGGEPRRLTYHPGPDEAVAWSPDGRNILFNSLRSTARDLPQLFSVPAAGGFPTPLPLPSGNEASPSPDGTHLAYTPFNQWQPAWKHYRGGQTARIWIADLADAKVKPIPRNNSNDRNPIWVGDQVYFLSDRNGPATLFVHDPRTGDVKQVLPNDKGFDIASASAGPGGIVYHQFGALKLYDFQTGQSRRIPVTLAADLPQVRPHFERVAPDHVLHAALSPTGKRVLFEARGEILSVPADKGDVRNLTQSPGVADRDPAWSPDGKWVAWFSDESGEYALHLRAPDGLGPVRKIALGQPPSFFYSPVWSPDSHKLAFTDKRLNLWMVDLDHPVPQKVDQDRYDSPATRLDPAWSPDSGWLAYTKQLPNHLHAAYLYNLAEKKAHAVTDGLSDVLAPHFDKNGKQLYFISGTSQGLGAGWLDMSSMGRAVNSSVYVLLLTRDQASPLAPESDEETPAKAEDKDKEKDKKPVPVKVDFQGLDQRILALPIPRANFQDLRTGAEGIVFAVASPTVSSDEDYLEAEGPGRQDITRLDLKTRKAEKFLEGADQGSFDVSFDGAKVLFAQEGKWTVTGSDKAPKPGEGALKTADLQVWVEPRAEWKQMYRETWRLERDFLYDPKAHGLDLARAERLYGGFLDGIKGRMDLNTLFEEMTGHLALGHTFIRGGAAPAQARVNVGLLGADYRIAQGRYQFAKVLAGENWNPKLAAPLTAPGVNVAEGEFLLAVNGQDLQADGEVERAFQGLAGRQTVLTVGPKADGSGSRQVTVVPVASDTKLRLKSWVDANRRKVDELSGGRVAYVFLPDTANGGFTFFNRYFFAQVGKEAVVLDERFNHGGEIADYIVDQLKKTPQMINATREGDEVVEPAQAIFGPKVMLINQMSGSGGDALPWLFRKAALGPLVGTRTWGGLVGIGGYPPLVDGGTVTAPRWALYGTKGEWEVENIGIAPDVEVEQDPALMRQGRDPQLEKGVQLALDLLNKTPMQKFQRPAYPDYKPVLPEALD